MVGYIRKYSKRFDVKRIAFIIIAIFSICFLSIIVFSSSEAANAVGGSSKCLIEINSGRVLLDSNAHARLPMASTTKAMTALLAVESGKMKEIVTVPKSAAGVEGSSIYLKAGNKLSLETLTYGLMLRSGNDAAETIAHFLGGSNKNFAHMMNQRAELLGLKNTHFVNPHGLHDDNHYTSAYDLAIIAAEGLKNPLYKKIVSTKAITLKEESCSYTFVNKNKLLFQNDDCIGVKTGYTKKAGRCFISASEKNDFGVVAVVLNVPPMFEECTFMMKCAYEQYEYKTILPADSAVTSIPYQKNKAFRAPVVVKSGVKYPVKKDNSEKISVQFKTIDFVSGALDFDAVVGKAEVYIDNRLIFSENLYMMETY